MSKETSTNPEIPESKWYKYRLPLLTASNIAIGLLAPPPLRLFTSINARVAENERAKLAALSLEPTAEKVADHAASKCSPSLAAMDCWPIRQCEEEDFMFRPETVERGIGVCDRYSKSEMPIKKDSESKTYSKEKVSLYGWPRY